MPKNCDVAVIDAPARAHGKELTNLLHHAETILIPVMPSAIDVRYAARFVAELLLLAQLDRDSIQVGIVANRTRRNTRSLHQLMRFLSSLRIPVVSILRDSQAFVRATDEGLGICDLPPYQSKQDRPSIDRLVAWLDGEPIPDGIEDVPLRARRTAARPGAGPH